LQRLIKIQPSGFYSPAYHHSPCQKSKTAIRKNIASIRDKKEKDFPRCMPHCAMLRRYSDVPEQTNKMKGISMALLARRKNEVCLGM